MENQPAPPVNEPTPPASDNTHTFGMLCHLLALSALVGVPFGNILGPLVMWLIKKEEIPFVDECGKESLNFQISMTLYSAALGLVCLPFLIVPIVGVIFVFFAAMALFAIVVLGITFVVIAAIRTSEGQSYQYPLTIRFLK